MIVDTGLEMTKETLQVVCGEMLEFISRVVKSMPLHDAFTRMKWIHITRAYSSFEAIWFLIYKVFNAFRLMGVDVL